MKEKIFQIYGDKLLVESKNIVLKSNVKYFLSGELCVFIYRNKRLIHHTSSAKGELEEINIKDLKINDSYNFHFIKNTGFKTDFISIDINSKDGHKFKFTFKFEFIISDKKVFIEKNLNTKNIFTIIDFENQFKNELSIIIRNYLNTLNYNDLKKVPIVEEKLSELIKNKKNNFFDNSGFKFCQIIGRGRNINA